MKKSSKVLSSVLIVSMLVGSLTACGKSEKKNETTEATETAEATEATTEEIKGEALVDPAYIHPGSYNDLEDPFGDTSDYWYPEGDVIRIVCDNHSAHKSKETRNFLAARPEGRFVFVFTPKHGSWLNMIESFFSKMTRQMLKGIRVKSKEELERRIYLYFEEVNREPVVYHWTYKMDDVSVAEAVEAGVKSNEEICAS